MSIDRVNLRKSYVNMVKLVAVAVLVFAVSGLREIVAEPTAPSAGTAEANNRRAVVYIIDKSSSMAWIFDELKGIVKATIAKSSPGDSVTVVLFGDSVTTLASYKNLDNSKKEILSKLIDSVSADALYTCLDAAVIQGTRCLHEYSRENVADTYTLVLVTDGKNHPPPNYIGEQTIEEALTQFPDFLPGKQWSLRYIALSGQIDPELLALAEKYGGSFYDVEKIVQLSAKKEGEIVRDIIENGEKWEQLEAQIVDCLGEVYIKKREQDTWLIIPKDTSQRVSPGDEVKVGAGSKAVISFGQIGRVGLQEKVDITIDSSQVRPLDNSTTIKLKLQEGTLWNAVGALPSGSLNYEVLTPIALTGIRGTVFRVSLDPEILRQDVAVVEGLAEIVPSERSPKFRALRLAAGTYSEILSGKPPSAPRPIPKAILDEWNGWKKILLGDVSLREQFAARVNIANALVMGPLEPDKECNGELVFDLVGDIPLDGIKILAIPKIVLPEGVSCEAHVKIDYPKRRVHISVTVTASKDADIPEKETWHGKLLLKSSSPTLSFSENSIPFKVHSAELVHRRSPRRPLVIDLNFWEWIKGHWQWAALLMVLIPSYFVGLTLAERYRRYGTFTEKLEEPEGWLIVLERPTGSDHENIDLRSVSRKVKKPILVIGRSPGCDIRLAHASVDKRHAQIRSLREGTSASVYIKSLGVSDVKVNNFIIIKEVRLMDRDIVDIGAFQFFYSNSHMKQVVVHYKDGTVKFGVLQTWNIEDEGFVLKPEGMSSQMLSVYIGFEDLKGVFFVKDFDPEISKKIKFSPIYKDKTHLTIEFLDGEKMDGYTVQDYDPKAPRFFFVPQSAKSGKENTVSVLVERTFVKRITVLPPPD